MVPDAGAVIGGISALWLLTTPGITTSPPDVVAVPITCHVVGTPLLNPSNKMIRSPGVFGRGSQLSLTPSPSGSLGGLAASIGHGSHASPSGSPSSFAWFAFAV